MGNGLWRDFYLKNNQRECESWLKGNAVLGSILAIANVGDGFGGPLFFGTERGDRNLSCTTVLEVNVVTFSPCAWWRVSGFVVAAHPPSPSMMQERGRSRAKASTISEKRSVSCLGGCRASPVRRPCG